MQWGASIFARRGSLAAIGVAALMVVAGCGSSSKPSSTASGSHASFYTGGAPGGTPVKGGKIVVDESETPNTMDPLAINTTDGGDAVRQICEGLVESVSNSKEAKPDLATSWTISPNGTTYTFHIREGVKFSNGEPLTGQDVVYSLERWKLPIATYGAVLNQYVKRVSLASPMTVVIQLKRPYPAFLDYLTLAPLAMVSKNAVQHDGEHAFGLHPVCTGPFTIKSSAPGYSSFTMVRNPYYWRTGQPYVNEVVYNVIPEANARVLAVRSGAATIDLGVPFSQAESLKAATAGARLLIEPYSSSSVALFNSASGPLAEVNVRKALNYATPREAIIKSVFKGLGTPSNDFPTNQLDYYDASVPSFSYDIAKAKSLLKASKVPHGFSTSILIYSGEPNSLLIASILQSAWAKIGVNLKIQSAESTTAIADVVKGDYQIGLFTPEEIVPESYPPDLDAYYYYDGAPGTGSFYKSARVTALVEKATSTTSEAVRSKAFREIQRIANWEDAAFLNVAFVPQLNLVGTSLHGFTDQPTSYYNLREAWVE